PRIKAIGSFVVKRVVREKRAAYLKESICGLGFIHFDDLPRHGEVLRKRGGTRALVVYGMGYRREVVEDVGIERILAGTHLRYLPADQVLLVRSQRRPGSGKQRSDCQGLSAPRLFQCNLNAVSKAHRNCPGTILRVNQGNGCQDQYGGQKVLHEVKPSNS